MKKVTRQDVLNQLISNYQKQLFTAIPGNFVAFTDQNHQRAQVQIGVQRVDVYGSVFTPPPIIDVPVVFPGGDYALEFELDSGAEGLIVFSQRCVDGWKQSGGVGVNPVARFHHPQDAFFIPGARSLKTAMTGFQNNGIRLRDKAGTSYIWLKNDTTVQAQNPKGSVTLGADGSSTQKNANGSIVLGADGSVNANGTVIDKNGNIIMKSGATITDGQGVVVETHKHGGVESGGSTTEGPQS